MNHPRMTANGIVRICNQHNVQLRHIGADLVCPIGHVCAFDWHLQETVPYADPIKRICPTHGTRLIGSGTILECQYDGHKCTTVRPPSPTKPETSMPAPKPGDKSPLKPRRDAVESSAAAQFGLVPPGRKRLSPGTVSPHGTAQRYWSGCKGPEGCQPCKDAVNEHMKARKIARLKAEGKPLPKPRATKPRRIAAKAVANSLARRVSRPIDAVVVTPTNGAALEGRILSLRADLASAEEAYLAHVSTLITNVEISRA